MYIFKAAVVGAGTMGGEIAQVISFSGLPVVLKDVDQEMLDKGMETIRHIYQSRVDKGKMSAGEMESKIALIEPTPHLRQLRRRRHRDRGRAREDGDQEAGAGRAGRRCVPETDDLRQQHLGALDQRDGRGDEAARQGDRHALLQPGARHEAGGDHPRAGDSAGDDRRRGDVHRVAAQAGRGRAGVPRLPGQPPADALPERSDLRACRRARPPPPRSTRR